MNNEEKIFATIKKARTSIDNILGTIEKGDKERCFSLMQQNLAVIGMLKSANIMMLENHLGEQIDSMKNKTGAEKKRMQQLRDEVVRIVKAAQNK